MNCPHCGIALRLEKDDRREVLARALGRDAPPAKTYEMTTLIRQDDGTLVRKPEMGTGNYSRQEPARAPTIESDVRVPLAHSLITGAFVTVPVAAIYLAKGGPDPLAAIPTVFFVSSGFFWWLRSGEMRSLMWRIEEWTKQDIDRDGHTGPPPASNNGGGTVVIHPRTRDEIEWKDLSAKERIDDVVDFASFIYQRDQLGQSWGQKEFRRLGYYLPSGTRVDDDVHRIIMNDYLLVSGLATKRGKTWNLSSMCSREHVIRGRFNGWD